MNNIKQRFDYQRYSATQRGIGWELTFEQWLDIWETSGHLSERGARKGQYCMSRKGDVGPYSVENVFIQLHSANVKEAHIGKAKPYKQGSKPRKLSPAQINGVRASSDIYTNLCKQYKVSLATIWKIKTNAGNYGVF